MATTFAAGAAQEVNTTTTGDQTGASVTMLANGGHMVAWNSNGSVFAQVFDASGAKSGGEFELFADSMLGGIAALADASIVASAWQTSGDASGPHSTVYYERVGTSGNVIVGPTVVDNTGNYDVWVSAGAAYAMPGGGFGIDDIHMGRPVPLQSLDEQIKVYDAAGNPTGASIPTKNEFLQETAQMKAGIFVTEGSTDFGPTPVDSAMWRTVDAQGNTIASVALTGQYSVNGYNEGGVAAFNDGRALVVWAFIQYGANGVGNTTWQGQWIDASGHASGGVFTLALDTQWNPKFTALADGSFIATWEQQTNYGTPYDLYAQHFTSQAQPDSGPVYLASLGNGSATGDTSYTITATPDGGFLLESQRSGDGQDIWEQKFNVASSSSGSGTGVVTSSHFPGIDEVTYPGAHTAYTITQGSQGLQITGPSGTDSLAGIERVHFSDGFAVALDVTGDAGEAYRLYQAAFDRAPDLSGLGFQMNDLDMGYSLAHVAQNFIDSPEFQSKYGPGLSNTEFITLLYQNVLHRDPEAAGLQYHLNEFAQGDTRADMLTHFSESPENQANVVGTIADGMLYIPYA